MNFRDLIVAFVCFFVIQISFSQSAKYYGTEHGLGSHNIHCGLQSDDGHIWVGTTKGLYRFDGFIFIPFNSIFHYEHGGLQVFQMHEDHQRNLWLATSDGVAIFNTVSYQFDTIHHKQLIRQLHGKRVNKLFVSKHYANTIFFGDELGVLYQYSIETKKIKRHYRENLTGKGFGQSYNVLTYKDLIFVKSNFNNAMVYSVTNEKLIHIFKNFNEPENALFQYDSDSNIVYITQNGRYRIYTEDFSYQRVINQEENFTRFHFHNPNGQLWWIDYYSEQFGYTDKKKKQHNLSYLINKSAYNYGLKGIFFDKKNNAWICTSNRLIQVFLNKPYFNRLLTETTEQNNQISTRALYPLNDSILLIGTYSGLGKLNLKTNKFELSLATLEGTEFIPYLILPINNEALLIATEGSGLWKYNPKDHQISSIYIEAAFRENSFNRFFLSADYSFSDSSYYLGTYKGIIRYHLPSNTTQILKVLPAYYGLNNTFIRCLKFINQNELLIGTTKGLFLWSVVENKAIRIELKDKLANSTIHQIEIINENIFIATDDFGLLACDLNLNLKHHLHVGNGLSSNSCYSFIYSDSILFIGTSFGLNKWNLKSNKIVKYYEEDGLSNNDFNHSSFLSSKDKTLFFGTINGITKINSNALNDEKKSSRVFLSEIGYYDENGNYLVSFLNKRITIPAKNRFLSLKVGMADYLNATLNQFQYRLVSRDDELLSVRNNQINYTGLQPGNYKLYIKGINESGITSENELLIEFNVEAYFFETFLFKCLIFLIVSLVLGYIILSQRLHIKELSSIRTGIASNLHDEAGTYLSRLRMGLDLLKIKNNTIHNDIEKLSEILQTLSINFRDFSWMVDARKSTVEDLSEKMTELCWLLFENSDVNYKIHVEGIKQSNLKINYNIKQDIFYIYKEALQNIAKHAAGAKVNIQISLSETRILRIIIENTIHQNNNNQTFKTGIGLKNMEMRAKRIHANFEVKIDNNYRILIEKRLKHNLLLQYDFFGNRRR